MVKVKVKVTQDHINRGEPGDCGNCPVALAIKDTLHFPDSLIAVAEAHEPTVYIRTKENKRLSLILPVEALRFILNFDNNNPSKTKPFEFELEYDETQDN